MKKNEMSFDDFMKQEYKMEIDPYFNQEYALEGYVLTCPELPGIKVFGESIEEALEELNEAKIAWYEMKEELGEAIYPPLYKKERPSGRLTARFPISLHEEIIEYAEINKTSINTAISYLVSEGLKAQHFNTVLNELKDIRKQITDRPAEITINFSEKVSNKHDFKWSNMVQTQSKAIPSYQDSKFKFEDAPFH